MANGQSLIDPLFSNDGMDVWPCQQPAGSQWTEVCSACVLPQCSCLLYIWMYLLFRLFTSLICNHNFIVDEKYQQVKQKVNFGFVHAPKSVHKLKVLRTMQKILSSFYFTHLL